MPLAAVAVTLTGPPAVVAVTLPVDDTETTDEAVGPQVKVAPGTGAPVASNAAAASCTEAPTSRVSWPGVTTTDATVGPGLEGLELHAAATSVTSVRRTKGRSRHFAPTESSKSKVESRGVSAVRRLSVAPFSSCDEPWRDANGGMGDLDGYM